MSTISTKDRPITIDQAIDDLDITPTAFRVYLHLLRLEITNPGEDVNLQAVADHCFRHTAQRKRMDMLGEALIELREMELIEYETPARKA